MRPTLVSLGPWSVALLPLVIVVAFAFVLLWQWAEHRWAGARPLSLKRALLSLLPAAALAYLVFLLVNRFGPIEIKAWGTFLVVAFAAGTAFLARYGDRKVIGAGESLDLALYCLIGAVLGARLLFVALDWGTYAARPGHLLNVWEGGLSFHGGLLGAILAAWLFAAMRHRSFPALLDELGPCVALGYAFARVGCFLNGCCSGHACDQPWAVRFPHGVLPNVAVHPTQLYAVAASLIIFAIVLKLRGKFPRPGHLFLSYLAMYSVARFFLEITRAGATGRLLLPWLTVAQLASAVIFALAVAAIALTWRCRAGGGGRNVRTCTPPASPSGTDSPAG